MGNWGQISCALYFESTWQVTCDRNKNNKLCIKVIQISANSKVLRIDSEKKIDRSKIATVIRSIRFFEIKFYPVDSSNSLNVHVLIDAQDAFKRVEEVCDLLNRIE